MVASQVQKELFKKWLKENRNISESTFISYTEGVLDKIHEVIKLSNDAKLKNLNPDLYSYDTLDKYDKFFNILKNDPNFDIVNKTGQAQSGWLSTPLNHYRRYLEAQPQENNSTEKLIEYIKQYKVFKSSNEYDEEYKWDYAKKHQGDFNTLDNFENKINSLENYNIRPYFLQRTGLNNLMQPYNIETFKNSLKILFDENKNLEIRIKEFLNNLHHLLKNDVHWNNKNMLPDEVDASYFLFTNNYEKYLLFNPKTSFNCFAKHFGLFDLLDKSDKVKRYIRFQEYCQNQLIPIMNDTLGCQNTLLDAQDFIRFVDKYILKNINNLEYNKDAVKTVQYKETHMNENTNPLNQILYGPPGTGKTYNTVIKAMEITNPELIQKDKDGNVENYEVLKEKFDELKQQGQIEFVTFHQSYSYEEFVEGIKPDLENGKELRYKLQNGIFKTICNNAKELLETKVKYNFNKDNISVYKILIPDESLFAYCIENDCVAINWGNDIDISNCDSQEEIIAKIPEDFESRKQCISQLNLFKLWIDNDLKSGKDVIVIIPGSMNTIKGIAKITGDYFYNSDIENGHQQRKVDWIRKNINISSDSIYNSKFVSPTITGMFNDKINWDTFLNLINNKNNSKSSNAVLVIDEINRGDVSKIFGELITLIEEDKRIGKEHQMTVTLPYSREPFGVPNNLYIIGTMNTADRSIALLDTALRRRFDFEEMMPKPELLRGKDIEGVDLEQLLTKINDRIKNEYDRDHQIGHSYLMGVKNKEQLERAYKNRILPLLNEYFYNDIDSVAKILNCKPNDISSKENWFNVLKEAQKPTKKENEQ
jgi:5-methylcytosine-specific restriction protein B